LQQCPTILKNNKSGCTIFTAIRLYQKRLPATRSAAFFDEQNKLP